MSTQNVELVITNYAFTASLNCFLDLKFICNNSCNVEYKRRHFVHLIKKLHNPSITSLIYQSGKIIVTGAKSDQAGRRGIRKIARMIQRLGYNVRITDIKLQNISGCYDYKSHFNLGHLSRYFSTKASYDDTHQTYNGLIVRHNNAAILLYRTGKCIITGKRSVIELNSIFDWFTNELTNYEFNQILEKQINCNNSIDDLFE
jgi:transcription initiation factor TFIID TATA-box-binding protein